MSKKTAKVLFDFIEVTATKKIEDSQIRHDKILAAVSTFATPDVDMITYQKDIDKADGLIKLVDGGDKSKTEDRTDAIRLLDSDNRILANYVTRIAKGSEAIIQLASFTPTKTVISPVKIPEQAVLTGTPGKVMGDIKLEVDKLEGASTYTYIVGKDLSNVSFDNGTVIMNPPPAVEGVIPPSAPVMVRTSRSNKATIHNLESRTDYQCISFGTSTAGSGKVSQVIIVKSF